MDRRRLMLLPAITIGIVSCQYTFEKAAVKAEFADSKSVIKLLYFVSVLTRKRTSNLKKKRQQGLS